MPQVVLLTGPASYTDQLKTALQATGQLLAVFSYYPQWVMEYNTGAQRTYKGYHRFPWAKERYVWYSGSHRRRISTELELTAWAYVLSSLVSDQLLQRRIPPEKNSPSAFGVDMRRFSPLVLPFTGPFRLLYGGQRKKSLSKGGACSI